MNLDIEPYLTKARECMAGAHSELANARYNNAANRAYYAAYNAAIVALIRAGRTSHRWGHDEVQAAFAGELIGRRKLYPSELRRSLPGLTIIRGRADYGGKLALRRDAFNAVREADRFLQLVLGKNQ